MCIYLANWLQFSDSNDVHPSRIEYWDVIHYENKTHVKTRVIIIIIIYRCEKHL